MRGMYSIAIVALALSATCWAQTSTDATAATELMQNDGADEKNPSAATTPVADSPGSSMETTSSTVPPLNHTQATPADGEEKDGDAAVTTTTMKTDTTKTGTGSKTEKPKDNGSYVIHSSIVLLMLGVLSAIYQS